jgi:tetratricopeptide (TPR) repeat protein
MPVKIRKKNEDAGAKGQDQVMTGLVTTYDLLDKYKYHITAGFAAVVVILLAVSWWTGYRNDKLKELGKSFFNAFKFTEAQVGEEAKGTAELPAFKTEKEKFEKVIEQMEAFLAEHPDDKISETARLTLASAKMEVEDYETALKLLAEYAAENPGSAMTPIILENLGYACTHLQKFDEAIKHFESMKAAATSPYLGARALVHLGDMYNPASKSLAAGKDAAKARQYYDEALQLLPKEEEEGPKADPAVGLTRHEIELRLSLLDLG